MVLVESLHRNTYLPPHARVVSNLDQALLFSDLLWRVLVLGYQRGVLSTLFDILVQLVTFRSVLLFDGTRLKLLLLVGSVVLWWGTWLRDGLS